MNKGRLVIFGVIGAAYGILMFFVGRHALHTLMGGTLFETGPAQGYLIVGIGIVLTLLAVAGASIKLMKALDVHKM